MPIYQCRVIDRNGATQEFVREAGSEDVLVRELSREELYPVLLRESRIDRKGAGTGRRFSKRAVLELADTLKILLGSGLSLPDALEVAQTVHLKGDVNRMVVLLLERIKKGTSVYDALTEFAESFPPIFKGFVRIGERVGSLQEAFARLSEYLTRERKLKDKIATSLSYPILVLCVAVCGIAGIALFVIPRIQSMFLQMGSDLQGKLQPMIRSLNTTVYLVGIVVVLSVLGAVFLAVVRKVEGPASEKADRFLLRIPFLGKILFLRETLNLMYAMQILTEGGYSVEDALLESSDVLTNRALRSGILRVREKITKGESLSKAFLEEPLFFERIARWTAVGERSGDIQKIFAQLSSYYQEETERWPTRFMSLIEPALILFVGVIILLIVIFFVMPIFSIYGELF